jgi:hypothetical protein
VTERLADVIGQVEEAVLAAATHEPWSTDKLASNPHGADALDTAQLRLAHLREHELGLRLLRDGAARTTSRAERSRLAALEGVLLAQLGQTAQASACLAEALADAEEPADAARIPRTITARVRQAECDRLSGGARFSDVRAGTFRLFDSDHPLTVATLAADLAHQVEPAATPAAASPAAAQLSTGATSAGTTLTGGSPAGPPLTGGPHAGEHTAGKLVTGERIAGYPPTTRRPAVGERVAGDPVVGTRVAGSTVVSDPALSEHVVGGPTVSERALGENAVSERALGENAAGEHAMSDSPRSDSALGERAAGERGRGRTGAGGLAGVDSFALDGSRADGSAADSSGSESSAAGTAPTGSAAASSSVRGDAVGAPVARSPNLGALAGNINRTNPGEPGADVAARVLGRHHPLTVVLAAAARPEGDALARTAAQAALVLGVGHSVTRMLDERLRFCRRTGPNTTPTHPSHHRRHRDRHHCHERADRRSDRCHRDRIHPHRRRPDPDRQRRCRTT